MLASTGHTLLIVWEHGSPWGHLARLLPVARNLRTQGYRVIFAVPPSGAVQQVIQQAQFDTTTLPAVQWHPQQGYQILGPSDEAPREICASFLR